MQSKGKASRTLRRFLLPAYVPASESSSPLLQGFASSVPGLPWCLVAYGTIESKPTHRGEYPVMFDARTVIAIEEVIRNTDGHRRCVATLRGPARQIVRVAFDMTRDAMEAAALKARA